MVIVKNKCYNLVVQIEVKALSKTSWLLRQMKCPFIFHRKNQQRVISQRPVVYLWLQISAERHSYMCHALLTGIITHHSLAS